MRRFAFDIETDNLLPDLTTCHTIAIRNLDNLDQVVSYGPDKIEEALGHLNSADLLVGHNSTTFDRKAIAKLYPDFQFKDSIIWRDTLVLARLLCPDVMTDDFQRGYTEEQLPRRLRGKHSLEAWGRRLDVYKGDFGKTTDWSEWSPEMESYCRQDTLVTAKLWWALKPDSHNQKSIQFEHEIAEICDQIGNAGWVFDIEKATQLYTQLKLEKETLEEQLQDLFPSWTIDTEFVPKVNNAKLGYEKGVPIIKSKPVTFNPNSRHHIERCLKEKYDWKPSEYTPAGDAKLSESVLVGLPYPEAQALARSFMLAKRLGQLGEGNAAWLRKVDEDGKIRHTINPIGAVTMRCSSFGPNLQQVPSTRAAYGKECRELFTVDEGCQLVGADLSSIEARVLAHYLPDGGEYAKQLLEGDVHQENADRLGIDRSSAKTFLYALLYGAGDTRLGETVSQGAKAGRELRDQFYKANPAFKTLQNQISRAFDSRGHLIGLDGRQLTVRSAHSALNVLIQSASAILAKKWVQLVTQEIKHRGMDAQILSFIHDELQTETKGDPHDAGNLICRLATEAGRAFNIQCPIEAEYSVGRTWADTH